MNEDMEMRRPKLLALGFAFALAACMPAAEEDTGPSAPTGGKTTGGNQATGGKATGGAPSGTGGAPATGGNSATGGNQATGGSNSATGGGGGSSGPIGGRPDAGLNADASYVPWEDFTLAIDNCVYCHPGEGSVQMNSRFDDAAKLHATLLAATTYVPSACQWKTMVVPGKPLESLLYLKLFDPPPANCGARMPKTAKPAEQWAIDRIRNWILSGAPGPKK